MLPLGLLPSISLSFFLCQDPSGLSDMERSRLERDLEEAVGHDPFRRRLARKRLLDGGPELKKALVPLLKVPADRDMAAVVLGFLSASDASGVLRRLTKSPDSNLRKKALESLGNLGEPDALPIFLEALGGEEMDVALSAARALWNYDLEQVSSKIRTRRKSGDRTRDWVVQYALSNRWSEDYEPLLMSRSDGDSRALVAVFYNLEELYPLPGSLKKRLEGIALDSREDKVTRSRALDLVHRWYELSPEFLVRAWKGDDGVREAVVKLFHESLDPYTAADLWMRSLCDVEHREALENVMLIKTHKSERSTWTEWWKAHEAELLDAGVAKAKERGVQALRDYQWRNGHLQHMLYQTHTVKRGGLKKEFLLNTGLAASTWMALGIRPGDAGLDLAVRYVTKSFPALEEVDDYWFVEIVGHDLTALTTYERLGGGNEQLIAESRSKSDEMLRGLWNSRRPYGGWAGDFAQSAQGNLTQNAHWNTLQTHAAVQVLYQLHRAGRTQVPASEWQKVLDLLVKHQTREGAWYFDTEGSGRDARVSLSFGAAADLLMCMNGIHGGKSGGILQDLPALRKASSYFQTQLRDFDSRVAGPTDRFLALVNLMTWATLHESLLGRPALPGIDWFGKGARFILKSQRSDGTWGGVDMSYMRSGGEYLEQREFLEDTCYALQFLAKSWTTK